jgi:ADP-ribosylglycohydrolase
MRNIAKDVLLGVAVGDALGVPVEFESRTYLTENPVTDMQEFGTHFQPKGTWSDDSSLTFCLAESLLNGYNLADIAEKFCLWRENAYWTAHNEVFDIGITTDDSLRKVRKILNIRDYTALHQLANNDNPTQNGNGSLMRILPLLLYIKEMEIEKQFEIIWEVSALTHPHIRAATERNNFSVAESMKLSVGSFHLTIPNGTDPQLLAQTLRIVKELEC